MEIEPSSSAAPSDFERQAEAPRLCRVKRWRGYVSSSFYVDLGDGRLLESSSFPWRHASPPPETDASRAAYDDLVARLAAAGWGPYGSGWCWYETTFAYGAPVKAAKVGGERTRAVPVPARRRAQPAASRRRRRSRRRIQRAGLKVGAAIVPIAIAGGLALTRGDSHSSGPNTASTATSLQHATQSPVAHHRPSRSPKLHSQRLESLFRASGGCPVAPGPSMSAQKLCGAADG